MADIPNEVVAPLHGDDFNDDLLRGAVKTDYDSPVITSEGALGADDTPANAPPGWPGVFALAPVQE